jgi:tetratricopeptide (TPR) repeat protein
VTERDWETARLDELPPSEGRPQWIPIRRHLGVRAFGVNAWTGDDGDAVIDAHEEVNTGHEEMYLVLAGHAEFIVGGETVDAPEGTIVFVRDPATQRAATAKAEGTTILSMGAKPGEAFEKQPWETNSEILPLFDRGDFAGAKEQLVEALAERPDSAPFLYNLACAESQLGEHDAALEHLGRAVELSSQFAGYAQTDSDLEPIRSDPRFPVAS